MYVSACTDIKPHVQQSGWLVVTSGGLNGWLSLPTYFTALHLYTQ